MAARRKVPFTVAETKRLIEAARASGLKSPVPVYRILPNGTLELTAREHTGDDLDKNVNEWDRALGLD
jgi:hypothetical protein